MKKILSLFLLLIFVLSLSTPSFSAPAKGKISLSGNMEDLRRGVSFEVVVELNRNPGISSLRTALTFDPNILAVEKAESLGILPGFSADKSEGQVLLRWAAKKESSEITARGKIALITFRVLDDAIYGDSSISLNVSQKLYDAVNGSGDSIPFDTVSLPFTLTCPHKNPYLTTVTEATFEEMGAAKSICPDCGEIKDVPLFPTLSSEDGKTIATLNIGEFKNDDRKSLRTEYIFGGEEAQEAKKLFGKNLVRAFRIHITKTTADYVPQSPCTISLEINFDLEENTVLYALQDGGAELIPFEKEGNKLKFSYRDAVFAFVLRENEEPTVPSSTVTSTKKEEVTTSSAFMEEEIKKKDLTLIFIGVGALVLCGAAAIFLTRKTKRF
ncbi:MAG: hypothetical protein IKU24_02095 [Clostridia bacterium]|nr:hypothetical protein [Clostridia bacterium]